MKHLIILAALFGSSVSFGQELFSSCEHVSELVVLAKDNVPYWTTNRNSAVQSCYEDIKEFVAVASVEDLEQFNFEYAGQIYIYTTDAEFAGHIQSKIETVNKYTIPVPVSHSITPSLKPNNPSFFGSI